MARYKYEVADYLFHQGGNNNLHTVFGAFPTKKGRGIGYRFRLWAPEVAGVSVVGEFNDFCPTAHPMSQTADLEIWEVFIPRVEKGQLYRYAITTKNGKQLFRADPFATDGQVVDNIPFSRTVEPSTYDWHSPMPIFPKDMPPNIYSVHLGSWKKDRYGQNPNYKEIGEELSSYVARMNYTHVHVLPLMEYKSDLTWGYAPIFPFVPTHRYGTAEELKAFVDAFHQKGIGVILEIPLGYFPREEEVLERFNGDALYEQQDQRGGKNFDYNRSEVHSYLLSLCTYWMETFKLDGIKLDGVSSMLFPQFGRRGERWRPSAFAPENTEVVEFLRKLGIVMAENFPHSLLLAEEVPTMEGITFPVKAGGLGVSYCYNINWTGDLLDYIALTESYRSVHHERIADWLRYPSSEQTFLCCDHNQFVHGRESLMGRMVGENWQQFAMIRCFFGYMMTAFGGKFLFMGGEIGQMTQWDFQKSLEWTRLNHIVNQDLQRFVQELNLLYRNEPLLWATDNLNLLPTKDDGYGNSMLIFTRGDLLVILNFADKKHVHYTVTVPLGGGYEEQINSDNIAYNGKGNMNHKPIYTTLIDGQHTLTLNIPPLGLTLLKRQEETPC